jgi:hypothetical protein
MAGLRTHRTGYPHLGLLLLALLIAVLLLLASGDSPVLSAVVG